MTERRTMSRMKWLLLLLFWMTQTWLKLVKMLKWKDGSCERWSEEWNWSWNWSLLLNACYSRHSIRENERWREKRDSEWCDGAWKGTKKLFLELSLNFERDRESYEKMGKGDVLTTTRKWRYSWKRFSYLFFLFVAYTLHLLLLVLTTKKRDKWIEAMIYYLRLICITFCCVSKQTEHPISVLSFSTLLCGNLFTWHHLYSLSLPERWRRNGRRIEETDY